MKKLYPFLLTLLLCTNAICQEPAITMTTTKAVGSEISFSLRANASNTPIQIDFGDGNLVSKVININGFSIKDTLVGSQTVKIYGLGITYFYCSSQQLTQLDVSKNVELEELDCSFNKLSELNVSENAALIELDCWANQISALNLINCPRLTYLRCAANNLTVLNITQNVLLTKLYCSGNKLTALDVSKNVALADLYCSDNQLTTLDVTQNVKLIDLDCQVNQISVLDLTKNIALSFLDLHKNQLTFINVTKNPSLIELSCSYNKLTELDVTKNLALKELFCYKNQLTALDVTLNTELTRFDCSYNQITLLDVTKNTKITRLFCKVNKLSALDVTKDTALTELDCSVNRLTFSSLPIKQTQWETYDYRGQERIPIAKSINIYGEMDLSDQNLVNGNATVYTWKTQGYSTLIEGNDYIIRNGKTVFRTLQSDSVYCQMTNATFPDLTLITSYTKIISPTAIPNLNASDVEIYANQNAIYISTPYNAQVSVFDTNGKQILARHVTIGINSIPLQHAGIYLVKLLGSNKVSTKKIIIQ